ncbi:MAG: hypothetical protein QM744_01650 [Mesorhizobium sp.]
MASAFISSCASTLDSGLESNSAAFNATAPTEGAAEEVSADGTAASNSLAMAETKEVGDPQLPQQVASVPMSTPKADGLTSTDGAC